MTAVESFLDDSAERAVLGAIIMHNAAMDDVVDILEPEHFRRHHNAALFRLMVEQHNHRRPMDTITLVGIVGRLGTPEITPAYISSLTDGMPVRANVIAYANIVRDKWVKRELVAVSRVTLADAEADLVNSLELLERTESALHRLSGSAIKSDWISASELAGEVFESIERMSAHRGQMTGVPTGLVDLDDMTRGLQKSDLILLGARPSLGKTALALQVALHAARSVQVAFFSVEMSRLPLGHRALSGQTQINGWRMRMGQLSDVEMHRIGDGISALSELLFHIDESPTLSPMHVRSKLRKLRAKVGTIGLVVIDYLQLMAPMPEHKKENKTNQVAGVSRALKILAREFDAPFLVLSQLNRGGETAGKAPQMSDLRDSGALEQDADVVLLLHRPEVYEKDKPELAGVAQLIVGKHRNGPVGSIELKWHKELTRFEGAA